MFVFLAAAAGTWIVAARHFVRHDGPGRVQELFDIGDVFGLFRLDSNDVNPTMLIANRSDFRGALLRLDSNDGGMLFCA
jgi:hypothetical protein